MFIKNPVSWLKEEMYSTLDGSRSARLIEHVRICDVCGTERKGAYAVIGTKEEVDIRGRAHNRPPLNETLNVLCPSCKSFSHRAVSRCFPLGLHGTLQQRLVRVLSATKRLLELRQRHPYKNWILLRILRERVTVLKELETWFDRPSAQFDIVLAHFAVDQYRRNRISPTSNRFRNSDPSIGFLEWRISILSPRGWKNWPIALVYYYRMSGSKLLREAQSTQYAPPPEIRSLLPERFPNSVPESRLQFRFASQSSTLRSNMSDVPTETSIIATPGPSESLEFVSSPPNHPAGSPSPMNVQTTAASIRDRIADIDFEPWIMLAVMILAVIVVVATAIWIANVGAAMAFWGVLWLTCLLSGLAVPFFILAAVFSLRTTSEATDLMFSGLMAILIATATWSFGPLRDRPLWPDVMPVVQGCDNLFRRAIASGDITLAYWDTTGRVVNDGFQEILKASSNNDTAKMVAAVHQLSIELDMCWTWQVDGDCIAYVQRIRSELQDFEQALHKYHILKLELKMSNQHLPTDIVKKNDLGDEELAKRFMKVVSEVAVSRMEAGMFLSERYPGRTFKYNSADLK